MSSLHVSCSGYGSRGRDELSVVLPITTRKEINGAIKEVFPEYPKPKIELKTHPRSYMSFYLHPIIFTALPLLAFGVFYYFLPTWYAVAYPAIFLFPALWLAICRTLSMFTTGFGFSDGFMTMRYSRIYTFHTVIVPKDRITKVIIRQSPFQRLGGSCTVIVRTTSEQSPKHLMRGLPLKRALDLFAANGFELYYSESPK